MGLIIAIVLFILLAIFGGLSYFSDHKKGQRLSRFQIIIIFIFIAVLLFGILDTCNKDSDSKKNTESIIKAINNQKKEEALIGLATNPPDGIINPVLVPAVYFKNGFAMRVAITNKGQGIAYNLEDLASIVEIDKGLITITTNDNLGLTKNLFIAYNDVYTIHSRFLRSNNSIDSSVSTFFV